MPAKIEAKIKRGVRKAHPNYSERQVTAETFSVMNKRGFVKGNKETAKGRRAEQHFEIVHHQD